jgi:hypothetical protein
MTLKELLNLGELNKLAAVFRSTLLGERLHAGGVRLQRETLAVASAAATPGYTVLHLLHAKTTGTGAAGEKTPLVNGATPSAGQAAPNAGGTSIAFNAETTGAGTVDVVYLTADPPKNADGVAGSDLAATVTGIG